MDVFQSLPEMPYVIKRIIPKTSCDPQARSLNIGDHFYTETMNFKALQKRKRETEISKKTGKYIRKKRFVKTLGNRAPAMFITILEEKVKRLGGTFVHVNTQTFKASQYCHVKNTFIKKPLSKRWHPIDKETTIQRDLYSAFLLMNSNKSGAKTNRNKCKKTFPLFKNLHDQAIKFILEEKKMVICGSIRERSLYTPGSLCHA